MPDKSEKERRKQIMNEPQKKSNEEFDNSHPMSRELFKNLFDYLDTVPGDKDCDHTFKLTEEFLRLGQCP